MKKIILIVVCIFLMTGCATTNQSTKKKSLAQNATKAAKIEATDKQSPDTTIVNNNADSSDEAIIEQFRLVEEEVQSINDTSTDTNLEKKLKKDFIILTDFIFYDGTIHGKTFNELSDEAKAKILVIYEKIDNKIDSLFPNYKEELRKSTNKVYNNIKEGIAKLKEKYKEKVGDEAYDNTIKIYEEDKERLKEAYEPVIDKAKEKASEVKEKAKSWYQKFKEENE